LLYIPDHNVGSLTNFHATLLLPKTGEEISGYTVEYDLKELIARQSKSKATRIKNK
jgi:hypothetical protein